MTSNLPGLIPLTQMHDLSLTWFDTSNTNAWPLTYLAWYRLHKYMSSQLPGLVPLAPIHDLTLTWLDTSNTNTWPLTYLARYVHFNEEEFEDTKGAIRIRISKKNRQHNSQKKKYKRTNDLQNIHIKPKIEQQERH